MEARRVELIKQLFGLKTDDQVESFSDTFGLNAEGSEMGKRLDRIAKLQDYLYKDPANSLDTKVKEFDRTRLENAELNSQISRAAAADRAGQVIAGAVTLDHAHWIDGLRSDSSQKSWREVQATVDLYRQKALDVTEQLKDEVEALQADIFSEKRAAGKGGQHQFNTGLVNKRAGLEAEVKRCEGLPDTDTNKKKAKKALADFDKMTNGFAAAAEDFDNAQADKTQDISHRANRITGPSQHNDLVSARKRREALGKNQDEELENASFFTAQKFVRASGVGWNSFMFKKEKGRRMPRAITLPEMTVKKDKNGKIQRDPNTGEKIWEMKFDQETLEVLPYLSPAEEMKFFMEVARRYRAAGRTTVQMTNPDGSICTSHGCLTRLNKYLKACAKIGYYPDATEYLKACDKAGAGKDETVRQWLARIILPREYAYYAGGNPYDEAVRRNQKSALSREEQGEALARGALSQELQEARELYQGAASGLGLSSDRELRDLRQVVGDTAVTDGKNRPQDFAAKAEQLKQKTEVNAKRLSTLQHQLQVVNNLYGSEDKRERFKQLLDEQTKEAIKAREDSVDDFESSDSLEEARRKYIQVVIEPEAQQLSADMQALQFEKYAFDDMVDYPYHWEASEEQEFDQCGDSDAITRVNKVAQALNGDPPEPGTSRPDKSFDEISQATNTLILDIDESLAAENSPQANVP